MTWPKLTQLNKVMEPILTMILTVVGVIALFGIYGIEWKKK